MLLVLEVLVLVFEVLVLVFDVRVLVMVVCPSRGSGGGLRMDAFFKSSIPLILVGRAVEVLSEDSETVLGQGSLLGGRGGDASIGSTVELLCLLEDSAVSSSSEGMDFVRGGIGGGF